MPNAHALWLVTAKADSSPEEQLEDLQQALGHGKLGHAVNVRFPDFRTGTLSDLLTLSETLVKHDAQTTTNLTKTVDQIKSLTSSDNSNNTNSTSSSRSSDLARHLVLDDGRPYLDYVLPPTPNDQPWQWNRSKYRTESKSLQEIVDTLMKEVGSVENAQRNKGSQYALVKGQLQTAQRKKTGNLSMRSLADIVSPEDFSATSKSEYLETVMVAVPKNLVKEWDSSYERLAQMVVPRSSTKIATDDEFTLFGVTIFKRVRDEFAQKCREQKFIVRDFTYDRDAIEKQKHDLTELESQEKELWTDLLRLSRINFSDLFQILIHIKVVRAYIESVLRYGLPAAYFAAIIKPDPKQSTKLVQTLSSHFGTGSKSSKVKKRGQDSSTDTALAGEFANVLEEEYLDFVFFEIEKVGDEPQ
ncbi:Vacuolar ATP synthase subunit C [Microbotryomycetes sp. JL201]|nr:Vacuolar ATP synthase subunit C [Microbotryomycetes sp. JL201]